MSHSFSVDEIQKMRVKLKNSTSFPSDMRQQQTPVAAVPAHHDQHQLHLPMHHHLHHNHEEGDNSSSGVSSDQEMTGGGHSHTSHVTPVAAAKTHQQQQQQQPYVSSHIIHSHPKQLQQQMEMNKSSTPAKGTGSTMAGVGFGTLRKKSHHHHIRTIDMDREAAAMAQSDHDDDDDRDALDQDSPSPPSKGFQRHNSLTRKQAASIAMSRAMQTRSSAVSLVKLPPPIESDHDEPDTTILPMAMRNSPHNLRRIGAAGGVAAAVAPENIVLAPPPQFCDCIHASGQQQQQATQAHPAAKSMSSVIANGGGTIRGVRIVGALPKVNTNVNVMNEMLKSGDIS